MAAETPSSDTIFCAAIEMASDSERAAYIAQACGEDEPLQARVQKLVEAHFRAGSFLESPADVGATVDSQPPAEEDIPGQWHAEAPRSRPVAERPGAVIGPYKMVQEIGEGGMGTVFLAQQTVPVKRLVALKVIKPGMDSRQVIARFEAERQALALMDHPNIAKVLDAGATDSGRPYFVMELVKGIPITKYCDEHHLTPRLRLELMVPVCQAVQHAHQKGIIHRDLKPSNVLVASYDGKPVPKVIDFGVAKATGQQLTEHTLVTGFGAVVGTLEYMSPEQAEFNQMDIDTRSDVYSLGVLLYELLTGTTPLEKKRLKEAAMLEVLRIIREEEPPRPSTRLSTVEGLPSIAACRGLEPKKLSGVVRGELDWIVMKALEKDRARRYETANGFGQDIQRYLADEPVQACPPSMLYRLRKMSRRNRAALTAAALVVLALVLGIAVSTWQAVEATQARDADRKSRDALDTAREEKEQQRTRTDRELSDALVEVVRLQEKVRTARSGDAESANQLRAMLGRAETLAAKELVDPILVGRVRAVQAEVNQDEKDRRMVARLEEIRLTQGTGALQGDRLVTYSGAAAPAYQAAFRDYGIPIPDFFSFNSIPPAERVEEVARRIAASPIRDALVAALDDCASNDGQWVARLLPLAQRVEQNNAWRRQYFEARIRSDRAAMVRLAKEPEALAQPPAILVNFAREVSMGGDRVGAAYLLQEAQRQHPADLWINVGLANKGGNDALGFLRAALAARPESVALHHELALRLQEFQRGDEAMAVYRQSIRLKPDNAHAYIEIGRILETRERQLDIDGAIAACRKTLEINPKAARAYVVWAIALSMKDEPSAAAAAMQKAVAADPPSAARLYAEYARGLVPFFVAVYNSGAVTRKQRADAEKRLHEGEVACYKAMELAARVGANRDELRQIAQQCVNVLAVGDWDTKDWDRAAATARKLIELDPNNAPVYRFLGWCLQKKGDWDGATVAYRKTIELMPNISDVYDRLAFVLSMKGDREGAPAFYRKMIESNPNNIILPRSLAESLWRKDDMDGAVAVYRKVIELAPKADPTSAGKLYAECARGLLPLHRVAVAAYNSKGLPAGQRAAAEKRLHEVEVAYYQAMELAANFGTKREELARITQECLGIPAVNNWDIKDWDSATAASRQVVELNPDDAVGYRLLGWCLQKKRDWDGAAAAYRKVIELEPDITACVHLKSVLSMKGDRAGALAFYRTMIESNPKNVILHRSLTEALRRGSDFDGAIACYRKMIELDPKDVWAYGYLSWLLEGRDWDGAEVACRKVIELTPKDAGAYSSLGRLLRRRGQGKRDSEGAEAAYRKAIELDPKNAFAYDSLGDLLLGKRDRDGSIAAYRKASELKPEVRDFHSHLISALWVKGDLDDVIAANRRAIAIGPGFRDFHWGLGRVLRTKGDLDGAIVAFRKVPEVSSNFAPAQMDLGAALSTKGDRDGAVAACRKAIEREPKWSIAHLGLAQALVDKGEFDSAIVAYQHAVELASLPATVGLNRASGLSALPNESVVPLAPAYHTVVNDFAWFLATCREPKFRDAAKAVELAKKATERALKVGTFWNTLGVAHYRAGDWKAAVAAFDKSMELRAGGDAFDWFFLAMSHHKLGQADEAKKWYAKAVGWLEKNGSALAKNPRSAAELRRFRDEAEEVLGLKKR